MNRTAASALLAGVLAVLPPGMVDAEPITYTDTIVASGTLGTTMFTGANVTFQIPSDTTQVGSGGGDYSTPPTTTATVTIGGVGTATLTDSFYVFDSQPDSDVGF